MEDTRYEQDSKPLVKKEKERKEGIRTRFVLDIYFTNSLVIPKTYTLLF